MSPSINFLALIGQGKVPEVLVGTWMVMALLLVFGLAARGALARAADPLLPDEGFGLRSFAEWLVEWLDEFVKTVMDTHDYRELVPFLGSIFIFIVSANLFGLIPGMEPPTSVSDLTFGLGFICFCFYIVRGVKAKGVLGYLRSLLGPLLFLAPLMLPIELADNLFRPFSLGVRLYANMFADHNVLSIFTGLTKLIVPLAFYALGSIVSIIQAIIFMVLTMSYIKLAEMHEH